MSDRIAAPEFVSFHADRPVGAAAAHPHTSLASRGYMAMLDMLYRSARLFHPGAACTLLTEAATRVRGIRGRVRRLDTAVDHAALMFSRALAQLRCVETGTFARPLVLVDSDILFRASLQEVFAQDFDVGLTWRLNKKMPINGGLILLHNRRPDVARGFFRRFLGIYRDRYGTGDSASWYGDQLALLDCVGLRREQMERQALHVVDGVRILFLPCDTYNFSPDDTWTAIASGLPDKCVLHFKGARKRLMEPFWAAFLARQESRMPWVRWAADRQCQRIAALAAAEQDAAARAGAAVGS
ncbi:MAG: hypothetical protein IPK26_30775 [Planctomycetes bacterium]|nr:hypothetical protein [Planctomycetota bacterium]